MLSQGKRSGAESRNSIASATTKPLKKQIPIHSITFTNEQHSSRQQIRSSQESVPRESLHTGAAPRNYQSAFKTLPASNSNVEQQPNANSPLSSHQPQYSITSKQQIQVMQSERSALLGHMKNASASYRLTKSRSSVKEVVTQSGSTKLRKMSHKRMSQRNGNAVQTATQEPMTKTQVKGILSGEHPQESQFLSQRMSVTPVNIESNFSSIVKQQSSSSKRTLQDGVKVRKLRPFTASSSSKKKDQATIPTRGARQSIGSRQSISGITSTPLIQSERQTDYQLSQVRVGEDDAMITGGRQDYNNLQTITTLLQQKLPNSSNSNDYQPDHNQHQLQHQRIIPHQQSTRSIASATKPPRPNADHQQQMIINQQYQERPQQEQQALKTRTTNSNQMTSTQQQREQVKKTASNYSHQGSLPPGPDQDYFILDDQNRVILVNNTSGQHPNTVSSHVSQQRGSSKSGTRSGDHNRSLQKMQTVLMPQTQSAGPKAHHHKQGKIVEQLTGSNKRKSSKATKALKENAKECVGLLDHHESQKDNRNSNKNMKTTQGVTSSANRQQNQLLSQQAFSTTTSTYIPVSQGATVLHNPQTGAIYQVDPNNLNYIVSQVNQGTSGGSQVAGHPRQLAHRPSAYQNQQMALQQYFSNPQHQQQTPTATLDQSQKHQSQTRSRPRSSAPTKGLSNANKKRHQNASRDMPRGSNKHQEKPGKATRQLQHPNDNLIQTAGHIIVTNVTSTPLGEVDLQQPQIIQGGAGHKQTNAPMILAYPSQIQAINTSQRVTQNATTVNKGGNLCITGLVHPDQIQKTSTNHSSQPPTRRRDNLASTQNGFFGKRKNRDSKLGMQQTTTPVTKGQSGNKPAISNPQQYVTSQENKEAGRPQTSKHQFHKTAASLSVNPNIITVPGQQIVFGATPVESDISIHKNGHNHERMSFDNRNVGEMITQGSQNMEQFMSSSLTGQTIMHHKNLSSVRSGTIVNYSNSISTTDQEGNDLMIHKQHSNNEKQKLINASASPGIKLSIRSRKGVSSFIGSGGVTNSTGGSGLQMLPSTPKVFKRTKRLMFARRMNLMDRPLLVVTFQGVLGDFIKKPHQGLKDVHTGPVTTTQPTTTKEKKAQAKEEEVVNLRAGVLEGLKYLSQLFQLIIFSRETIEDSWFDRHGGQTSASDIQTKAIQNWIQANPEIKLDGFYASQLSAKQQTMTDDYSQIFMDFGLNSEQKVKERVLFINAITSEFICNQRLPACANVSPKGKKPSATQLGISNARGLQDVDSHGYFMFDLSCQPAQPLVMGLPITLEIKSKKVGTRAPSIVETEESIQQNSQRSKDTTPVVTRHMATTLLVPNIRTQNVRNQTTFQHVIKTVMLLAFFGQKKTKIQHLHKDVSTKDITTDIEDIEADFGSIKEKQIKLSHKRLLISTSQLARGQSDVHQGNPANPQRQTMRHWNRQQLSNQRETESPASDMSGTNGSQKRNAFISGKTQSFKAQGTARAVVNYNIGETSSNHSQNNKMRSSSLNSEKWLQGTQENAYQLKANDSQQYAYVSEHSPPKDIITEPAQKDICVDLTDRDFYANLSWAKGVDHLHAKPRRQQKKYLGMQTALGDVVWRFYKKQTQERIQLRKIYEAKMQAAEQLVKRTLANETIMANQKKNIDEIFKILRQRDLVGNPFGFTMGRNYKFFANLSVQMRRKFSKELAQWNARNEAVVASQVTKEASKETSASAAATEASSNGEQHKSTEQKEIDESTRFNSILQSQQVLQQQHTEALEELLEKNQLINRFLIVGLDAPYQK